ncbi:hypothetical protein ANCCEY_08633 [Ancylostoma ceylanicum]|uniref:Uncharacterized protein n=1 Tax=Ancylostoma ceylanicum TaxID=53326 RepID=A0A0D6LK10_9BILA|nr:hypothetical protein ANCCEY_08633 [Ancylostoma ceylanicum]
MLTKAEHRDEKKSIAEGNIFVMDEDQRNESEVEESERLAKLDGGLRDVLSYIASKHNLNTEALGDTTWLRMSNESSAEELFTIFLSLLESRMLLSVHVRYTSFLWLYLCKINEKYASRTLDFLWSIIVRPQVAQADIAKAHGAAAYLAAFLARAKCLDVRYGKGVTLGFGSHRTFAFRPTEVHLCNSFIVIIYCLWIVVLNCRLNQCFLLTVIN